MTDDPIRAAAAPPPKPRRVYKLVSVGEADGQFRVLLDGKQAKTPARLPLATPNRSLAEAAAAEWDAQDPFIDVESMPITRLLATMLDRISGNRAAVIEALMSHVDGDALCYRADHPAALVVRQKAIWQPVLDWLAAEQSVALTTGVGIMPHTQSPAAVAALRVAIARLDDGQLTAFQACAGSVGSLALAMALTHGRLNGPETFAAAMLEEMFQAEQWGEDEVAQTRRDGIERDVLGAAEFLRLIAA